MCPPVCLLGVITCKIRASSCNILLLDLTSHSNIYHHTNITQPFAMAANPSQPPRRPTQSPLIYLPCLLVLLCHYHHRHSGADAFGIGAPRRQRTAQSITMTRKLDATSTADADAAAEGTTGCERIDGISSPALLEKYDTFLLDMWGGEWSKSIFYFLCTVDFFS